MPSFNPAAALQTYQQIMGMGSFGGHIESNAALSSPSFGDVMKQTFMQTADSLREHENLAVQQTLGTGDITKVITSAAELDVKTSTAVAFRDKLIAIIQELEKMQI